MPGRTFDVLLLSAIAGFVLFICCAVSGGVLIGGLFDKTDPVDGISDISARKMSPRR